MSSHWWGTLCQQELCPFRNHISWHVCSRLDCPLGNKEKAPHGNRCLHLTITDLLISSICSMRESISCKLFSITREMKNNTSQTLMITNAQIRMAPPTNSLYLLPVYSSSVFNNAISSTAKVCEARRHQSIYILYTQSGIARTPHSPPSS